MMPVQAVLLALTLSAGISLAAGEPLQAPPAPALSNTLQVVRVVALDVREPSDMCLDRDGVHWWTVSDHTGLVYQLCLSDCRVVKTLRYRGVDPEGVWQDPADGSLYITEEKTRQIVHLDAAGRVLGKVSVAGLGGEANSGLEGITSGPVTGRFYVTQEKHPARLVEVDAAGTVLALHDVEYVRDLSGVTHDPRTGQLVVVSDESRKVCWTDLAGGLVSSWNIPVRKAEGIAIDTTRSRLYVVSDREERFYEFRLP